MEGNERKDMIQCTIPSPHRHGRKEIEEEIRGRREGAHTRQHTDTKGKKKGERETLLLAGGGGGSLHECDPDGITSVDHKKNAATRRRKSFLFSFFSYYYIFHSLTKRRRKKLFRLFCSSSSSSSSYIYTGER